VFPLNWKFLRLWSFEKVGGVGRTDGRRATLNAAPREGRIIIHLYGVDQQGIQVDVWRSRIVCNSASLVATNNDLSRPIAACRAWPWWRHPAAECNIVSLWHRNVSVSRAAMV